MSARPEHSLALEVAAREVRAAWDEAAFPIRCPSPEYKRMQDALRHLDDALAAVERPTQRPVIDAGRPAPPGMYWAGDAFKPLGSTNV